MNCQKTGMIDPKNRCFSPLDRPTLPTSLSFTSQKHPLAYIFSAIKMHISEKKRWNTLCLKTCAGIRNFVQPGPEMDRPDRQTGAAESPDRGLKDEVYESGVIRQRLVSRRFSLTC